MKYLILLLLSFSIYAEALPVRLGHKYVKKPAKLIYLTEVERAQYVLTIKDGLLVTATGALFSTVGLRNDMGMFVVDKKGTIYASRFDSPMQYDHDTFLAGEEVMCAGYWHISKGDIFLINDRSSHYLFLDSENLNWFVDLLKKQDMNFDQVAIIHAD